MGMCSTTPSIASLSAKPGWQVKAIALHFSAKFQPWKLRWWFVGLPAGVGTATAKACLRLWCALKHYDALWFSAGNGPLMRAPLIVGSFMPAIPARQLFVVASTKLTHTDPLALVAANWIANLAAELATDEGFNGVKYRNK